MMHHFKQNEVKVSTSLKMADQPTVFFFQLGSKQQKN